MMHVLLLIAGVYTMTQDTTMDVVRDLRELIEQSGATVSVAVEHLGTGEKIMIDERRMYHAASTMKTPVMIEAYRQASRGIISLEDSIEVRNVFRSIVDSSEYAMDLGDDSDDEVYRRIGTRMSVNELIYAMITVSSNFATNILIELLGARAVTQTMRDLGANDIQVLRGVEDIKAYRLGLNNETHAYDLGVIMRSIGTGAAAGEPASQAMLDVLLDQKWKDKIPALLPEGTRVAHKTGSITGVQHDSGIVYMEDGQAYVIVLLSEGWDDAKRGQQVLAKISRRIFDHFAKGS